jgi:predicted anti-sigma-YlaC factor YlaD
MRTRDLNCEEIVELVTDYLEGELRGAPRRAFQRHLAGCDGCIGYVQQMRVSIRLTGRVTWSGLSAEARTELLEAFRGWRV